MSEIVKNRSEVLFLYDISYANPNGDPVDENKPRIDEETFINIVTDVRLKRTIRDYLYDYKKMEVFIREIRDEKGNLVTKEVRQGSFKGDRELIEKCIDVRLFGATTAVRGKTMTLTGPVQFKFGHSLHKVDLTYIKGTTVMPAGVEKKQGTFTEKYILPYSLIAFYGVVNENASAVQNINLTQDDVLVMLEAAWNGTKNLLSTSKAGQMPRLLLWVEHKERNYHLGELDKMVRFLSDKEDDQIRDITEGTLDITELINKLKANKDKILQLKFKVDNRLALTYNGLPVEAKEVFGEFNSAEFVF
jgi:CRISPR-associated protein Csh2